MIGWANLYVKRDGKIELHHIGTGEWMAHGPKGWRVGAIGETEESMTKKWVEQSKGWTPDLIVTEDEMLAINRATCSDTTQPNSHEHAGDCHHFIDADALGVEDKTLVGTS